MPKCVPIKDMRDTAAFALLVESSPEPITVTKNGYDQFVVLRSEDYDKLCQDGAKAQVMERIVVAEKERAEGSLLDAHEAAATIRQRYGL